MADEQNEQHTQESDGAADETDKKLIFGKYKTLEDAEKAHKELERDFHSGRQERSKFEERLELLESQRDEGYGRGRQTADYIPDESGSDKTRILTEFYTDPDKVLKQNRRQAVEEAKAELRKEAQQSNDHATRVNAWTADNQDVMPYGDLLTHYVGQTDGRLSIETRLSKAADQVRARVLQLKGKPEAGEPKPDDVVEGVDQSGAPAGGRKSAAPGKQNNDPESQLAGYATARNREARKPLGVPRAKA